MLAASALVVTSAALHAGWNLLAYGRRDGTALTLRVPLCVAAVGLGPALLAELRAPMLSPAVVGLLAFTGAAQALYYVGLSRARAASEFSLAYPLSRALPVLLLAGVELVRGRPPGASGLGGMALIATGCALAPLPHLRAFALERYRTRATAWILVIALATVAFTLLDRAALERLPPGPGVAARYGVWEAIATVPWLRGRFARADDVAAADTGRWALATAAMSFASYGLVLWAFQLGARASDTAALRQVSIPLGLLASRVLLGERANPLRIVAASLVTAGVALLLASAN